MAVPSRRVTLAKPSRAEAKASTLAEEVLIPVDIWPMATAMSTSMTAKTAQASRSSTRVKASRSRPGASFLRIVGGTDSLIASY